MLYKLDFTQPFSKYFERLRSILGSRHPTFEQVFVKTENRLKPIHRMRPRKNFGFFKSMRREDDAQRLITYFFTI